MRWTSWTACGLYLWALSQAVAQPAPDPAFARPERNPYAGFAAPRDSSTSAPTYLGPAPEIVAHPPITAAQFTQPAPEITRLPPLTREAPFTQAAPFAHVSSLPAPDSSGFSLELVQGLALQSSPRLRELSADVEAARGRAIQAGLYPNPTVGTFNVLQFSGSSSVYNFGAIQDLVTKGKLRLDQAAEMQRVQQACWLYRLGRYELLTKVRTQFIAAQIMQEKMLRLQGLTKLASDSLGVAERLQAAGEGTRTDALLLKIALRQAQISLQAMEQQILGAKQQLAATLGQPDLVIDTLVGDLSAPLPDYLEEAVKRRLISENARAQIARYEIHRNRLLYDRAVVEPFPNVQVQAGYQHQGATTDRTQGLVSFMLEVPLFDRNQGQIRAAAAEISRARAAQQSVQNELLGEVAIALAEYRSATTIEQQYLQEILPLARESQRLIQQGYQQGEFDLLRVLQSQRSLIESELGYLDAAQGRWTAAAKVAGMLQEERFP